MQLNHSPCVGLATKQVFQATDFRQWVAFSSSSFLLVFIFLKMQKRKTIFLTFYLRCEKSLKMAVVCSPFHSAFLAPWRLARITPWSDLPSCLAVSELFPIQMEGVKLTVNKGLSNHFQVRVSTCLFLVPSNNCS